MNTDIKKLTDETPMVGVATAALTGYALRYAMAAATGLLAELRWGWSNHFSFLGMWTDNHGGYDPVNDWEIGGPLIESDQVYIEPPHDMHRANFDEKTGKVKGCWETYESWHATVSARTRTLPPKHEGFPGIVGRGEGATPLIAVCRAIVASHFGDTVSVPVELVEASV